MKKPKHIYLVGWEESRKKTSYVYGLDTRKALRSIDLMSEDQARIICMGLGKNEKKRAIFKIVLHKVMD